MSCPVGVIDSYLLDGLVSNLGWISVLSCGSHRLLSTGANLGWISVLSCGSHRLLSTGANLGWISVLSCGSQSDSYLLGWISVLTWDGLVSCPVGVTDSHLLGLTWDGLVSCPVGSTGANLGWISVLSCGSHRLSSTGSQPKMD